MQYITIDEEYSLNYQLIGGEEGKPVLVFLHEGLGCIEMWKEFPTLLCAATKCPGLLYDRRGYGQSSPLGKDRDIEYLHEYAAKELPALLQAVIPDTPHILVGHSDGASISLIYGSQGEPLLKAIVAMAPHVFVESETRAGVRLAETAFKRNRAGGLTKYHGDKTEQIFKAWTETWLSSWFRDWNIEPLLSSIVSPVLIIHGSNDAYGTEKQVDAIASKVPGRVKPYIISGCSHSPHLERPQLVVDRICKFLLSL
jgi:pimeloyl-ACP methyl ester carboxylesterase